MTALGVEFPIVDYRQLNVFLNGCLFSIALFIGPDAAVHLQAGSSGLDTKPLTATIGFLS